MSNLRIGFIGLGARGYGLLSGVVFRMKDIEVIAVCDVYEDRVEDAQKLATRFFRPKPLGYVDYKELIKNHSDLDAVIIATSWETHMEIAEEFMRAGIAVGMEVGGAVSVDACWSLVKCYEETKTPIMMLENCCYGEHELAVLRMVREGVFGDVVHCAGGYKHDLREEIAFGEENRHYRLNEYKNRNCENYPTHEIGPIAKILDINYGNRFLSLTSTASCAKGMTRYINDRADKYPALAKLRGTEFKQGDVVNTIIKCANGQTVAIKLDTTLPRYYSRGFEVQGTKAYYTEDGNAFVDDNANQKGEGKKMKAGKIVKKYRHPIWTWFKKHGVMGGHGGMDWLVFKAFFDALRTEERVMPIDVYDGVTWMAITALSAESIANNSQPVEFPDFTGGAWETRKKQGKEIYYLERD